ncbi:hypothetical protein [Chitinophaga pinensis]|uniref:Lipocalin-like domain-containing protein n=1 Tax=Chitinophaga pinensis TaxID=79329 RepID=A0A5C6LT96_9BACT|nr:hypothetical protein [Chitinophaga pinensis]TWV99903.1 hypothetical protein FEF09_14490 [Chitinophaga pinensis]
MKKTFFLLFASILGIGSQGSAQDKTPLAFTDLIAKEWKLAYYGDNGKKQPPSKQQEDYRMTFFKDKRVLSVGQGKQDQGVWQYDSTTKVLTITDNKTKGILELQVMQLDSSQFVVGYKDPNGALVEIHMLAVRQ